MHRNRYLIEKCARNAIFYITLELIRRECHAKIEYSRNPYDRLIEKRHNNKNNNNLDSNRKMHLAAGGLHCICICIR